MKYLNYRETLYSMYDHYYSKKEHPNLTLYGYQNATLGQFELDFKENM